VADEPIDGSMSDASNAEAILSAKRVERDSDGSLLVKLHGAALSERLTRAFTHCEVNGAPVMHACVSRDMAIERLARALAATEDAEGAFDEDYAYAVGIAIVARLIGLQARSALLPAQRSSAGLQRWRLKRVIDYVDAHIAGRITLADMAEAAGLTRMHFAHQFKISMGVRPHEYVMRRRIESAQDMLLRSSSCRLVEVALSVGFQAQTHFTTTFKRFVGETPHRWRTSKACSRSVSSASRRLVDASRPCQPARPAVWNSARSTSSMFPNEPCTWTP
jgi:AraC-like DNA-binding protein